MATSTTVEGAIQGVLDTVRNEFGWVYGSFWRIDPASQVLRFEAESGDAGPEFRKVTLEASFVPGLGPSGRVWAQRDLVLTRHIGETSDCMRAPVAPRGGRNLGTCVPNHAADAFSATKGYR